MTKSQKNRERSASLRRTGIKPADDTSERAAFAALARLAGDEDPEVRESAVAVLRQSAFGTGGRAARRADALLLKALRDSDPAIRERATWAVTSVYDPAYPPGRRLLVGLVDALRTDSAERVRVGAAHALALVAAVEKGSGRAASKEIRSALVGALKDESKEVAGAAAEALAAGRVPERAVPLLVKLLCEAASGEGARLALEAAGRDRSPEARREFAKVLRATRQALRRAIRSRDRDCAEQEQFIAALGPHAACLTVSMLKAHLFVRACLQGPLESMGERGVRALCRAMNHPSPLIRERAAEALAFGDVRSTSVLPFLVAGSRDSVPAVRRAAALALGQVLAVAREGAQDISTGGDQ